MLPIFWLESADADLDRIIGYIAQRNYPAA